MKTSFVSSYSVFNTTKHTTMGLQNAVVKAQTEVTTGRHQDMGLALGYKAEVSLGLRRDLSEMDSIRSELGLANARYNSMDVALEAIGGVTEKLSATLLASRNTSTGKSVAEGAAKAAVGSLIEQLTTSFGGVPVFGGINFDDKVMEEYFSDPAPDSRVAVEAAFIAKFGFDQSDPAVSTISPTDMQDFLDNEFAGLFEDPAWNSNWSTAIDGEITNRVSQDTVAGTTVNANDQGFRKLLQAAVMVADFGTTNLSGGTFETIVDQAMGLLNAGTQETINIRGELGNLQERIAGADNKLARQATVLSSSLAEMEQVDVFEASSRLNQLVGQIELSYSLTGRIQQLSLMNYL